VRILLPYLILIFAGVFISPILNAEQKGMPPLKNYNPADYLNKGKIWDIRSSPSGMVYLAADKGLLEFDGRSWKAFKGSAGFTRSVLVLHDSLIYTGSDLDFGVWKRNRYQSLEYTSLYPYQKEVSDLNEEFWDTHSLGDDVVFVSSRNIYVYDGKQITKIAAPSGFTGSFLLGDTLYLMDQRYGLYAFSGNSLNQVSVLPGDKPLSLVGIYPDDDGLVVVTKDQGLFRVSQDGLKVLQTELTTTLRSAKVFSFERVGDSLLAFGTVLKGLYVSDLNGNILHQVNKHKGLPNNTVLCMHHSPSGKLWIGMDYGLSILDLAGRYSFFFDHRGDYGTAYTPMLKEGIFYMGTNQGLYQVPWEAMDNSREYTGFSILGGTEGQVWSLQEIGGEIFVGHDRGLFILKNDRMEWLIRSGGIWNTIQYRDYLLAGGYNGVYIFSKIRGRWEYQRKMELILGSCNQLIEGKDGALWIRIPNFGVIRAQLDSNLRPADRQIFQEADFTGSDPYLLRDQNGMHLITSQFQYTYDAKQGRFVQSERSSDEKEFAPAGITLFNGQSVQLSTEYRFHPVFNGFALERLRHNGQPVPAGAGVVFRSLEAHSTNESRMLYPGVSIPFRLNNVEVEFLMPNREEALYQYRLDDDGEWSLWSASTTFRFYNLRYGSHIILVRSRIGEWTSEISEVQFRIEAPWYQSWFAIGAYVLFLLIAAYLVVRVRRRFRLQQQRSIMAREKAKVREQEEEYRRKIEGLEQERLRISHDQLKQQLRAKTIELATKAKDNEDKNRLLLALKEKCEIAQRNPATSQIRWSEMQRMLDSYLKIEDHTFEIQMDELHQEFFRKLRERFPGLSNKDLRFCAYLKIGLSSKEIADILNIQPSSAFINRSRLRKKLNLNHDEDLHEFLNAI
jgi:DNA-binding CsgD family transcriptional regulator/ligand-binding sensor domain-containing protein